MSKQYDLRKNPRKSTRLTDEYDTTEQEHDDEEQTLSELDKIANNITSQIHKTTTEEHEEHPDTEEHNTNTTIDYTEFPLPVTTQPIPTETMTQPTQKQDTTGSDNDQLLTQIVQMMTNMGTSLTTLKSDLTNNLKAEINALDAKQTITLQTEMSALDNKLDRRISTLQTSLKAEMENQTITLQTEINQLENRVNDRINKFETETKVQVDQIQEKTEKLEVYVVKQIHQVTEQVIETKNISLHQHNLIQTNTNDIASQHTKLNQLEEEVTNIKTNQTSPGINLNQLPEIIIKHVSEMSTAELHVKLPKFNPKARNPPEFINQIEKYYDEYTKRRGDNNSLTYFELLEQCFEGSAATWFQIIKPDLKDSNDFRNKFLRQYWNNDIQKGIKRRIEVEKYRNDGKMNRMEYFIDRTLMLKSMIPPMDDVEIIELLANNFSERIHDAVKVQNINTFERFIEILNREDMEERTNKVKQRNESTHHKPTNYDNNKRNYEQKPTYERYNKFTPRNHPYENRNNQQQNNRNDNHYDRNNSYHNHNRNQNYNPSNNRQQYDQKRGGYQSYNNKPNHPNRSYEHPVNHIQINKDEHKSEYPNYEQKEWTEKLRRESEPKSRSPTPERRGRTDHSQQRARSPTPERRGRTYYSSRRNSLNSNALINP